jgi:hypothetical protein
MHIKRISVCVCVCVCVCVYTLINAYAGYRDHHALFKYIVSVTALDWEAVCWRSASVQVSMTMIL